MNIRPIRKSDNAELAKLIRAIFDEFDAPKKGTVYEEKILNLNFLFKNSGIK